MKKKFQSALLDPPGRYTGNNFLFKGGPRYRTCIYKLLVLCNEGFTGARSLSGSFENTRYLDLCEPGAFEN